LGVFLESAGDVEISQMTAQEIRAFLTWLCVEYESKRLSGDERPLLVRPAIRCLTSALAKGA
jgi:hypothetical protein